MSSGPAFLQGSRHPEHDSLIAEAYDMASSSSVSSTNVDTEHGVYIPSGCQALQYAAWRNGQGQFDHCCWQIQYYSDPLDSPNSPSATSLFAQTQKETDEIFYATFPAARISSRYGHGTNVGFDGIGFSFQSPLGGDSSFDSAMVSDVSVSAAAADYIEGHTNSELMTAINLSNGESAGQIDSNLSQPLPWPQWREQAEDFVEHPLPSPSPPTHDEMTSMEEVGNMVSCQCQIVSVPADVQCANEVEMFEIGDRSPTGSRSPALQDVPSQSFSADSPAKDANEWIQDLNLMPSPTGTWPSLRMRTHQGPSTSPVSCVNNVTVKTEDQQYVLPHPQLSVDPLTTSTVPSSIIVSSSLNAAGQNPVDPPALMRLSPLPAHRRPAEKKKAQTLACNFCRARKIACGPPLPGTTERTCNQCQRRSFKCVFPTESRRGMRKKKTPPKSDSPK